MRTPASIKSHPIHPMLIALPIGLWAFSLVCDIVHALGWGGEGWKQVALYTAAGGVIGALLAAIAGLVDLLSLPAGPLRRIGLAHMVTNLGVTVLFALSAWIRLDNPLAHSAVLMSVVGIVLLGVGGWLGGELVYVHRVGVDEGATSSARPETRRAELVAGHQRTTG